MEKKIAAIEQLASQGQLAEAYEEFKKILELEPDNLRARKDLAVTASALNQLGEAENIFNRLVEENPDEPEYRHGLALTLAKEEKWTELLPHLYHLLMADPANAGLWIFLAKASAAQKKFVSAFFYLRKAEELLPDKVEVQKLRHHIKDRQLLFEKEQCAQLDLPEVLLCLEPGWGGQAENLVRALAGKIKFTRLKSFDPDGVREALVGQGIIWFEGGSDLSAKITKNIVEFLHGKRLVLRLDSAEIFSHQAYGVQYTDISDVVFFNRYFKDLFLDRSSKLKLIDRQNLHVLHSGIICDDFPFLPGRNLNKLACVGDLTAHTDPLLLLHAFSQLAKKNQLLELHIAGAVTDVRYQLAVDNFIVQNKLAGRVKFYGKVTNLNEWFADKGFIMSASPFENQNIDLLGALHAGLRPLIHFFPGAERLYPRHYLWANFDELSELLSGGPSALECHNFVAEKYNIERLAQAFYQIFLGPGHTAMVEPDPVA